MRNAAPLSRGAAIGSLSASLILATTRPSRAQHLTTVRVGASLDDGLTPLLYGMQAGVFAAGGLDIQLQPAASGGSLAAAVIGGAVDIAKSNVMALITAHARGVQFRIVAGAAQYSAASPTTQLVTLRDSPLRTAADLKGKTIAVVSLGSIDVVSIQLFLDKNGGDSAAVKFIELPEAVMLSALESGRVDVALIVNPTLAAALASGNVRVFTSPYDAVGPRFLLAGWFAMEDFVAKNMDVVQRFSAALYRSALYTNAHHAETVPILAAYSHIDPAVIGRMTRQNNATALIANDLQPVIDAAAKYKVIDATFAAHDLLP
jgi:NitT/TauT family transport system substrate-binding protein